MSILNTKSMQIYERTLDAASLRNKVLANNIANVDTHNSQLIRSNTMRLYSYLAAILTN